MKPILAGMFGALCLTLTMALNAAETKVDAKQKVAADYFEALTSADVEKANALIDVPYSLDRKEILRTRAEVEAVHVKIAADKGKRAVPPYTIELTDKAPKLDAAIFPKHVAYRISLTLPGRERMETIDIYVTDSDTPKAIGFSD
ncbi:MAG: hypothetical protein WC058_01690 [Phycisphaeraceae bacterium]